MIVLALITASIGLVYTFWALKNLHSFTMKQLKWVVIADIWIMAIALVLFCNGLYYFLMVY